MNIEEGKGSQNVDEMGAVDLLETPTPWNMRHGTLRLPPGVN